MRGSRFNSSKIFGGLVGHRYRPLSQSFDLEDTHRSSSDSLRSSKTNLRDSIPLDDFSLPREDNSSQESSNASSRTHTTISRIAQIFCSPIAWMNRETPHEERTIDMSLERQRRNFPANVIRNQKYNPWTFIFVILYEQFRFFFNAYFLAVALSQFIPALKVGFLFTYISPLIFVLTITVGKEAYDDIKRGIRDREANGKIYKKLSSRGMIDVPSSTIRVGDLIYVDKDDRIPADMVFLRTKEKGGACFIRTDQLDGETDWKLRRAVSYTQRLASDEHLIGLKANVFAEKPKKDIYHFVGNFGRYASPDTPTMETEGLTVDNCLWANTVVASGGIIGLIIYTGRDTRSVMNTNIPGTKVGLLDLEINRLSKVLCALLLILSFIMVALKGFDAYWYLYFFRFMLLFSAIIPVSLRVNLDMAKTVYSMMIHRDRSIPGTIVRTSTIPEELGRIEYLLSDKTGTLTSNDMVFKKLHLGSVSFSKESLDEIGTHLRDAYVEERERNTQGSKQKIRRTITTRVRDAIRAIGVCHNVTPVEEEGVKTYQASSPDEVALVKFTDSVGLSLCARDVNHLSLLTPEGEVEEYEILHVFPFTSESKRMGIIVRHKGTSGIYFYMKGADVVMSTIVQHNDWLEEECSTMAREGLRTLVFGRKSLTPEAYGIFTKTSVVDREGAIQKVVQSLETDLDLLCLSGVEDRLQEDVKGTLETLSNAGIKVWMLTGDKVETAKCIATSARLVTRNQSMYTVTNVKTKGEALSQLQAFSLLRETCLVIDGTSLAVCLDSIRDKFIEVACRAPCVVCCRCSPTQKAEIVRAIREIKGAKTCAIGDGGNDVSMIQTADVGIGIVGKEGKQASLAADFSVNQFSFVSRLLYKRSARLGQFIIHRGLIISFIQAVFSAIFYFAAIAIYNGWLIVGYATIYTMAPVFNLVLDEDVPESIVFRFPELYKELQKGRSLSNKTFFIWTFTSVYQGGAIMLLSIALFEDSLVNIVSITFTALILTELANVAYEIHHWTRFMILSESITLLLYLCSMLLLSTYFDITFILSVGFAWRVLLVTLVSCMPLFLFRCIKRRLDPPSYSKLS
ncbi:ATPase, class II, type 9B [Planoprotostelium fungivorum]|uniref:Phospholipid-transporting ATPase n=1 Tax=Planoprotostelium fungivorum TaxID=1890364 RepID=A0A2P6NFS7_9EUKA|nr:ATPase, class II, type 9B [Planoprotostelium fungivorum]